MKLILWLERISKGSLYAAVLLLPLWFLPFTQNMVIYQKQTLLLVLVFVGLVAWLAKAVNQGEIRLRLSLIFIPAFLLLLGAGVSTLLSLWVSSSFWGWPLDVTDSFLTLAAFVLFSFLAFQVVQDHKELFRLLLVLLVSSGLAALYALAQVYGAYVLPFAFAKSSVFNTIGNSNDVSLFAAVLLPLALALAFVAKRQLRLALWVVAGILLACVVLFNFQTAWIVLIAGLLVLLAFGIWNMQKRAESGWISFPMALIIAAVFFLTFQVSLPGAPKDLPVQVSLSQRATLNVAKDVLKERALFGGGPGTFSLEYARHRPAELNQTIFFGTRFASGATELFDWFVTKGAVGLLLLLALFGVLKVVGAKSLVDFRGEKVVWMLQLGIFASLVALVVSQFLYPSSFLLWFVFWVLAAALALSAAPKTLHFTVSTYPFLALASSFVFLVVFVFGLGLLFLGGQKYAAEVLYLQGAKASAAGDLQGAIAKIGSAANLNGSVDIYWRDLAQLYLLKMNQVVGAAGLSQEQKQQQTQTAISNVVRAARAATSAAPANVANWNVQGFVYRSLIGIQGAEALAQEAYLKAAELEPTSPFPWTELARSQVMQAKNLGRQQGVSQIQGQMLENALENLQKALALKSDYAPAHYLLAVVYEQQGKVEEAVAKLEETKLIAQNDVGLAFQLGVIYWQRQEWDKAALELERARRINPNYSNARYILGLVYDVKGNKEAARQEFSAVWRLNPDNEEVQRILENLEQGLPALEGITPAQPPVQETPPEIQK
ncbi:MAG: hypothetical protein A2672_00060 [Candidatus Wildermuthbacteria bacterium RIFCSPHIGHO2_01_FULL_49_22b]|uniref:Uncharacterized protein n=1 Tax=Candidatus Wildermuthbacteria bacterium RIFCSPHIGHO2_01_FULL_49_22b TaxID=1802448 RepID=A0A1G2QZM4_9BACT|nr:MAG: hypothetical protein A2672_00060 [Candidatus Wildermuthbacteria bacterium RIFCSPHIGHO2_01_FULL_49_22b]